MLVNKDAARGSAGTTTGNIGDRLNLALSATTTHRQFARVSLQRITVGPGKYWSRCSKWNTRSTMRTGLRSHAYAY
jgi:hypothetical protein